MSAFEVKADIALNSRHVR